MSKPHVVICLSLRSTVRSALALLFAAALLLTACSAGEEPVSGGELQLTFDGESCTYEGPTLLKGGSVTRQLYNSDEGIALVTLKLNNNREDMAAMNLMMHTGDETIQDMIDYFGEEPSTLHTPVWAKSVAGVYGGTGAGESRIWEGELEPGIYSLVCVRFTPFGVWFGTGLEVVE